MQLGRIRRDTEHRQYYWASGNAQTQVVFDSNSDVLDAKITEAKGEGVFVTFNAKREAPAGNFEVAAHLADGKQALFPFRVSGRIEADVEAESEVVSFGYVEHDVSRSGALATAQFYSPYKHPFAFVPVASKLPIGFVIDSVTTDEDGRAKIALSINDGNLPLGLYREKAEFVFSVSDATLTVPITLYGYVLKRPSRSVLQE